jgi:hypothetical protein
MPVQAFGERRAWTTKHFPPREGSLLRLWIAQTIVERRRGALFLILMRVRLVCSAKSSSQLVSVSRDVACNSGVPLTHCRTAFCFSICTICYRELYAHSYLHIQTYLHLVTPPAYQSSQLKHQDTVSTNSKTAGVLFGRIFGRSRHGGTPRKMPSCKPLHNVIANPIFLRCQMCNPKSSSWWHNMGVLGYMCDSHGASSCPKPLQSQHRNLRTKPSGI